MAGRLVPVCSTRTTLPTPEPLDDRMDGAALIVTAPVDAVVIVTGVAAAAVEAAAVVLATVTTVADLVVEVVWRKATEESLNMISKCWKEIKAFSDPKLTR